MFERFRNFPRTAFEEVPECGDSGYAPASTERLKAVLGARDDDLSGRSCGSRAKIGQPTRVEKRHVATDDQAMCRGRVVPLRVLECSNDAAQGAFAGPEIRYDRRFTGRIAA